MRMQSMKDHTIITVMRQFWTVSSCQTPSPISIMSIIFCSDFPRYPRVPETLGYPGSNPAIRVPISKNNTNNIKKNLDFSFFFTLGVLKLRTAVFVIHLCVFMDTAIIIDTLASDLLFHWLAIYYC